MASRSCSSCPGCCPGRNLEKADLDVNSCHFLRPLLVQTHRSDNPRQFPTADLHNTCVATMAAACFGSAPHVPAGRKTKECRRASERVSARDVPGIKTRQRHCWEEERRSKGLSGKAAVAAGGKADGRAENLDADGAREQASGVETRDFYFIFMLKCKKRKISWDGFKRKISRYYFHL